MLGMTLVTHQTGPQGKLVQRLYIEEGTAIAKELYLSCLVDRETSTVAFIASTEGGVNIEEVAAKTPRQNRHHPCGPRHQAMRLSWAAALPRPSSSKATRSSNA